jgi:hypothetical protein
MFPPLTAQAMVLIAAVCKYRAMCLADLRVDLERYPALDDGRIETRVTIDAARFLPSHATWNVLKSLLFRPAGEHKVHSPITANLKFDLRLIVKLYYRFLLLRTLQY